jgi:hypothetical protein
VVLHWQHSAEVYAAYMSNGKKFRYAELLRVHNTSVKNLLAENLSIIPPDLKKDVEAIIEHYTIWTAKWDDLKSKLNPAADDEFAFANDHRFPKSAAKRLEAALDDLE